MDQFVNRGMARALWLLLIVFACTAAQAQPTVLEVIPLRYRAAAELIPVIQPLLAPGGSISGFQGQLVIRTTPANLEEIKGVLARLDAAPRQLVITAREEAEVERSRSSAELSGSVGGEHGRVTVPGSPDPRGGSVVLRDGDDSVRLRALESSGAQSARGTQSVRVMEGREAFLRIGQSVPVRERQVRRSVVGGRVVEEVVEGTQYREATSGIYVLARIAGERVTLEVSAQRESLSRQVPGGVSGHNIVTTASGRLGEWIEIGGISQDAGGSQSVLLGRTTTASRDSRRVLIKVEEAR